MEPIYGFRRDWPAAVCDMPAVALGVCLAGCVSPPVSMSRPFGAELVGKSKQDILSCAGNPLREVAVSDGTILRYYREAPMLEESSLGSKGSKAGVHGGCWTNILIVEDHMAGVENRPVPDPLISTDHCEEIFRSCAQ